MDMLAVTPMTPVTTTMSMPANATFVPAPATPSPTTKPKATAMHAKPQGLDHVKLPR
jgi:hypothetical protein